MLANKDILKKGRTGERVDTLLHTVKPRYRAHNSRVLDVIRSGFCRAMSNEHWIDPIECNLTEEYDKATSEKKRRGQTSQF
jgi:hypothetical protein